jgi:PAS domain S-box-containing protein
VNACQLAKVDGMKFLQHASINRKLTWLVAIAVATALALAYAAFVLNDVRTARHNLIEQMSVLSDVLASNSTAALTFDDKESAQQVLDSLSRESSVEAACIFTADGSPFVFYINPDSASPEIPNRAPDQRVSFGRSGHLNITTPILVRGEQIGTFFLHASMDDFYEQLANYSLTMGLVLLISFGAAYLLAARLQRVISQPILTLAHAAEQVSTEQDYSIRVKKVGNDELGVLFDAFNRMLDQVQASKQAVEAAHEKLARQSEEQMRAIVETAADGIITFAEDGTIDSCNGASCELLRATRNELVGSTFMQLIPDAAGVPWRIFLEKQLGDDGAQKRGARQFDALRKDGSSVPLLISLSEFPTDRGRGFTAILRDLTEYQRLHLELAQAQKLESIGQLAAGIAHEINTPMQFIGDNIGYLRDCIGQFTAVLDNYERLLDPDQPETSWEERCRQVAEIKRQTRFDFNREQIGQAIEESLVGVDRIIAIVRAMKQFSHLGSEQNVEVDLNDAIRSTATISRNRWKYVADLEMELDPDLPMLDCLSAEINQVLLNLVVNAADAIADKLGSEPETKGRITVRTKSDGEQVVVEVEDNGCGIPDQVRNRIFDPFFTTKDVGKGTGQGLAISHDIVVNKHHGSIQVESTTGKGTTFIIRLPLGDGEARSQAGREGSGAAAVAFDLDSNMTETENLIF